MFFFKVKVLSEWTKCGAKGPESEIQIKNVLRAKNAKCRKVHFWQMCVMQQKLRCPLWWPPRSHWSWEPACTSIVQLVDQMEWEGSHMLTGVLRNESRKMVEHFLLTPDQAHTPQTCASPVMVIALAGRPITGEEWSRFPPMKILLSSADFLQDNE